MDTLTFITKVLDTAAWPLVTIMLVFFLRKEIILILPRLKKFKAGPMEVDFDTAIKALRSQKETDPSQLKSFQSSPRQQRLLRLAPADPRSAILEAWLDVEKAVEKHGIDRPLRVPPSAFALYGELFSLRNQALHQTTFNPSQESVLSYIQLSDYLIGSLEQPDKSPTVHPSARRSSPAAKRRSLLKS